jgi:radical SAM superfamily enzyme YgiQ (UPF0313 family)
MGQRQTDPYNAGMSGCHRRTVVLIQLPIPALSPEPIRGNVPLAAGYLKLFAEQQGLDRSYWIEIFPPRQANSLGDRGIARALAERNPWLVGFTCHLWNIERTLWVAAELKRLCPSVRIVLGGPEITSDNAWVLERPEYDFAVIGEGEQTFVDLLRSLQNGNLVESSIPGLYVPRSGPGQRYDPQRRPPFRTPLPDLNRLGSPYLAGILDCAEERMLLLETTRGCVFKCKFCYYPKSYDGQYYLAPERVRDCLRHAQHQGVREVVLLDPTLNQRKDFADFLRLLGEANPGHVFTYFGELRGEGITEETARLLRAANLTEVEVGLQSIDPEAQRRMQRKNHLQAFERGVRAMLGQGIAVKVDLIVGLPGDTPESVRRGLHYLRDGGLYSDVQVFNLSILPGTDFRQEAAALGLVFQRRPPYYVLRTPTLEREEFYGLMQEAQDLFGIEFDAPPAPVVDLSQSIESSVWRIDLDAAFRPPAPAADVRTQVFTLWFASGQFDRHVDEAADLVRRVLADNPFTTLQVVLELPASVDSEPVRRSVTPALLQTLMSACQVTPTYLDRYYALQPGRPNGAKRLIILLPGKLRPQLGEEWIKTIGSVASVVWQAHPSKLPSEETLEAFEFAWASDCGRTFG